MDAGKERGGGAKQLRSVPDPVIVLLAAYRCCFGDGLGWILIPPVNSSQGLGVRGGWQLLIIYHTPE